jgi:hypothetical protein
MYLRFPRQLDKFDERLLILTKLYRLSFLLISARQDHHAWMATGAIYLL